MNITVVEIKYDPVKNIFDCSLVELTVLKMKVYRSDTPTIIKSTIPELK